MGSNQTMALLLLGVEIDDRDLSGHAFIAGMKFDVQMLKSCRIASDKEACLLNRQNSHGQIAPELYTCSFTPSGQVQNSLWDIRRVERMYFKKKMYYPGDEFITKIVSSELIDKLFVGTETESPSLYIENRESRYHLFLNNCVAFAVEQFEKYAQISLENSREVLFHTVYLPSILASSIRKYKKSDEYEQETNFKPRSYYESEQFMEDIDIYNEAGLVERFKILGID